MRHPVGEILFQQVLLRGNGSFGASLRLQHRVAQRPGFGQGNATGFFQIGRGDRLSARVFHEKLPGELAPLARALDEMLDRIEATCSRLGAFAAYAAQAAAPRPAAGSLPPSEQPTAPCANRPIVFRPWISDLTIYFRVAPRIRRAFSQSRSTVRSVTPSVSAISRSL